MALTQEEIRIRAGLDYSKVTAGLNTISAQVTKLATGVPAMLNGMLRTTLVGIGLSIAQKVLPTWSEIYDNIYGVDEETTKRLQQAGENLNKLRRTLKDAQKDLVQLKKDIAFGNSPDVKKQALLMADDVELAKEEKRMADAIAAWKNLRAELDAHGASKEQTSAITEKLATQEAELLRIQKERLLIQDKIYDLGEKMSKDVDREELPIRGAFARSVLRPGDVAAARERGDMGFVKGQIRARQVYNMHATGEMLSGLQGLPFLDGIGELGKQIMKSQEETMRNTVQKVKIVDIAD